MNQKETTWIKVNSMDGVTRLINLNTIASMYLNMGGDTVVQLNVADKPSFKIKGDKINQLAFMLNKTKNNIVINLSEEGD